MSTSERLIDDVAASVADGHAVDWDHQPPALSDRERRLLRHLRVIDSLATVYRSLPSEPEQDDSTPPPVELAQDGPRWGRLLLLDRIGQGVSGDVFRAWDGELQREVALKLLHVDGVSSDAAANARVLQEARRLARVRHPHIVHVYGAERHEERIGLWMELVRGRTLDEIVRTEGPMSPAAAAAIGADLCGAVAAVHAAGLLHRDIKCQNAVRDESGRVVLMDLGAGEEIGSTRTVLAGTPLYLAPEVLAGGQASVASDVYGLGVLLFHLLSGKYPVHAESIEKLKDAHAAGPRLDVRDAVPHVAKPLAGIVERALSSDARQRFATAGEMEQALREYLRDASRPADSTWSKWAVAALALVTAAVIGVLVAMLGSRTPSSASGQTSIAVLPLRAGSSDAATVEMADGLTAQLINTLGQVKTLRVSALPSVLHFKDRSQSPAAIAQQLGVDGVLDGTLLMETGSNGTARVRVNARVLKAGTGAELWSGTLERPLGNVAALETDLARALARSIHARLTPAEVTRLRAARGTTPAAEQAYLQGRAHLAQFASRATLALRAFQRAIELDPAYAAAHAGAARSYIAMGFDRAISQPEARALALAEATRALDLDPGLPEGHGVLGDLHFYYDWDFGGAEREYLLALDAEPSASYERSQYAQFLAAMQRFDEARRQIAEAQRLDPLSAQVALTNALILYYGRHYDEARAAAQHAESLDPTLPTTHFLMGRILEAAGDLNGAIEETRRAIDSSAVVAAGWRVQALRLEALQGRVPQARSGYAALVASGDAGDLGSSAHEAYIRTATGEPDAALAILDRAVSRRDVSVLWMTVDPRLDPIKGRPEFSALRRRIGLP
jgi:TolB-like protein